MFVDVNFLSISDTIVPNSVLVKPHLLGQYFKRDTENRSHYPIL